MQMSKTAAIRESAGATSIVGSGTSWQVYGPARVTNISGPSTAISADSYSKARRIATQWRAEVALALMGRWDDESRMAVMNMAYDEYESHTVQSFIEAGEKAFGTGASASDIADAAQSYWDAQ
jgi:hypothetical protein